MDADQEPITLGGARLPNPARLEAARLEAARLEAARLEAARLEAACQDVVACSLSSAG